MMVYLLFCVFLICIRLFPARKLFVETALGSSIETGQDAFMEFATKPQWDVDWSRLVDLATKCKAFNSRIPDVELNCHSHRDCVGDIDPTKQNRKYRTSNFLKGLKYLLSFCASGGQRATFPTASRMHLTYSMKRSIAIHEKVNAS